MTLAVASRLAHGDPGEAERPVVVGDAVRIVAGLSIAAGLIHALATIDHFGHWWAFGVFFLALTYGQILWGAVLLRRRVSDRALLLGAAANLAIVAVWLVSRTLGLPLGPQAGSAEPIGTMDIGATLDQLVLVAYTATIVRPRLRDARGFRALLGVHRVRLAVMLGSATFFAALLGGHPH